jgi:hypothetical protein
MDKLTAEGPRVGRYVVVRRGARSVLKHVAPLGDFERRVLEALAPALRSNGQQRYEAALRRARVRFAPTRFLARDLVAQAMVPGPSAKAWLTRRAGQMAADERITRAARRAILAPLREIAVWLERLAQREPGVRIDTALDNLIMSSRGPVLIDLFPPILVERFPPATSRRERLLTELFLSPPTQAAALVFFWFRPFARRLVESRRTVHVAPLVDDVEAARWSLRATLCRPAPPDLGSEALAFFRAAADAITDPAPSPAAWLERVERDHVRRSFLAFVERPDPTAAG